MKVQVINQPRAGCGGLGAHCIEVVVDEIPVDPGIGGVLQSGEPIPSVTDEPENLGFGPGVLDGPGKTAVALDQLGVGDRIGVNFRVRARPEIWLIVEIEEHRPVREIALHPVDEFILVHVFIGRIRGECERRTLLCHIVLESCLQVPCASVGPDSRVLASGRAAHVAVPVLVSGHIVDIGNCQKRGCSIGVTGLHRPAHGFARCVRILHTQHQIVVVLVVPICPCVRCVVLPVVCGPAVAPQANHRLSRGRDRLGGVEHVIDPINERRDRVHRGIAANVERHGSAARICAGAGLARSSAKCVSGSST